MRVVETDEGPVEFWHDTVRVDLPLVTYATTNVITRTGHSMTNLDTLAFREEAALRTTLAAAGLTVEQVLGDWDGSRVTAASPELIMIARKP